MEMSPKNIAQSLGKAEALCARGGLRLTRLRRAVLEILLDSASPVKAYDLIERMRDKGQRVTAATVYRTLDFLLESGLAHRVDSLNAYVACTGGHEEQAVLMFVCSSCQNAEEIDDPELYQGIMQRLGKLGMSRDASRVEIQGTCRNCGK